GLPGAGWTAPGGGGTGGAERRRAGEGRAAGGRKRAPGGRQRISRRSGRPRRLSPHRSGSAGPRRGRRLSTAARKPGETPRVRAPDTGLPGADRGYDGGAGPGDRRLRSIRRGVGGDADGAGAAPADPDG